MLFKIKVFSACPFLGIHSSLLSPFIWLPQNFQYPHQLWDQCILQPALSPQSQLTLLKNDGGVCFTICGSTRQKAAGKYSVFLPLWSAYSIDQQLPFQFFSVLAYYKIPAEVCPYATSKRHTLIIKAEIKDWEKIPHENTNQKKAGVSNKRSFKLGKVL